MIFKVTGKTASDAPLMKNSIKNPVKRLFISKLTERMAYVFLTELYSIQCKNKKRFLIEEQSFKNYTGTISNFFEEHSFISRNITKQ